MIDWCVMDTGFGQTMHEQFTIIHYLFFSFLIFQLSWADIYFTAILDYLNYMTKSDLVANHPNLQRVVDNVTSIESIRSWIDKRPKTEI